MRVAVDTWTPHARGVATGPDQRPVEIPGALPGEEVEVQIVHDGRARSHARVLRVLSAAADRVPSGCPHFLVCGGCDLLHASLEAQHAFKRHRVASALGLEVERVEPVTASATSEGYRSLAKWVVGSDGVLGSYRPRTHDVTDMTGCRIHAPAVEAIGSAVRDLRAVWTDGLRYVVARGSTSSGRVVVGLVTCDPEVPTLLAQALFARPEVARVVHHVNPAEGDALFGQGDDRVLHDDGAPVVQRIGPVRARIDVRAFSQINPGAAERLYARVAEMVGAQARVLELYAGAAGIGLTLLHGEVGTVRAAESVPAAVREGRRAAIEHGLDGRLDLRCESAASAAGDEAPVAVLNPPRKGAETEVLARLVAGPATRIVYVSCNPDTLARDVEALSQGGFRLERVAPVDLFPHTRHVETVAMLERSAPS